MSNGETGCSILKESFDLLVKEKTQANKYNKQIESGAYACLGFPNRVCKTWDYGDETLCCFKTDPLIGMLRYPAALLCGSKRLILGRE